MRHDVDYNTQPKLVHVPMQEEARRRRRLALDAAAQLEASAMAGPLLGYDENGMPILTAMPPPDFFEPQVRKQWPTQSSCW